MRSEIVRDGDHAAAYFEFASALTVGREIVNVTVSCRSYTIVIPYYLRLYLQPVSSVMNSFYEQIRNDCRDLHTDQVSSLNGAHPASLRTIDT